MFDVKKIDGIISESPSKVLFSNENVKVEWQENKEKIYLAVKSEKLFLASICICDQNKLTVYHVSAALGKILYLKSKEGIWSKKEEFEWDMSDKQPSDEAIKNRDIYFKNNGWIGYNSINIFPFWPINLFFYLL